MITNEIDTQEPTELTPVEVEYLEYVEERKRIEIQAEYTCEYYKRICR